ncbi:hypothetical protein [Demequina sp. SO4-18]|uniref:hypothetical protein n=1 Tax=Demequina sp. SO4-18 TaxID=3401026 RepID=UPI003B5A7BC2
MSATEARAVCESCGRKSRYVPVIDGRLYGADLPRGWVSAPYSPGFTHPDGTHGPKFTCPKCSRLDVRVVTKGVEGTEWKAAK